MKIKIIAFLLIIFIKTSGFTLSKQRIDELANWFASGMAEHEKEYKKAEPNALPNGYTQTEANMKLLADNYRSPYRSLYGNPKPVIKTLNDLRNNEDQLINWVLNIYKNQYYELISSRNSSI